MFCLDSPELAKSVTEVKEAVLHHRFAGKVARMAQNAMTSPSDEQLK